MTHLDQLAELNEFHGLHITTKLDSGRWAAAFRTRELPSVSGGPMYSTYFGATPFEAIENGAKALLAGESMNEEASAAIDDLI